MPERSGVCAIAVMAKAPRAGAVKTRLSPPLEPSEAQAMSAAFLRDTTENICAAAAQAAIHGYVAYAPAGLEHLFEGHLADGTQLVLADGAITAPDGVRGFGVCLLHAVQALLDQGYGAVCVLNADSPTLPTAYLVDLARHLARPGDRAVLGGSEDGGYYALGVKRAHAGLFADIAWSTGQVAEQTRARAAGLGVELVELPPWFDVDDRAALLRLLARPQPGEPAPYAAPATAGVVAGLNLARRLGV